MELIINGKPLTVDPQPGEMLSDLLRERLNLTGTKIGCNEAECGSCSVVVEGEAILACTFPAAKAEGRDVVTIEGLAGLLNVENIYHKEDKKGEINLHPLQRAFIDYGAVQCGFCIPGQIMTAFALLQHNPEPDEEVIRSALKDTLCRCAGYPSIINAVQAAADNLRTGNPIAAPELSSATPLEVIGKSYIRPDAADKVTGRTKFTDDLQFESMLHACVKRAEVPHGIVKRIDVEKARQVPGVEAVLTADDIPGERNHGLVIYDWPVLVGVGERVRTVGDAIAIIAAETREIAIQASDLIEVEIKKSVDGGYFVKIVSLEHCFTQADDVEELWLMVYDLVYSYYDVPEKLRPFMPVYFPKGEIKKKLQEWLKAIPAEFLNQPITFVQQGVSA